MKIENWNGHEIRWIEVDGEWNAVAIDIVKALGLKQVKRAIGSIKNGVTQSKVIDTMGRLQNVNVLNEKAIYKLVFKSSKPEAELFQDWVFDIIKTLRKSTGLEGFEVFRMLDKEHQKEAMEKLKNGLREPKKVNFIKANTIANKAVSNMYGYPKMAKKDEMTPEMIRDRQPILEDTVDLIKMTDKFNMNISVSETINNLYLKERRFIS